MKRVKPIIKAPSVGQIIRTSAVASDIYYVNGGSFVWVTLAPKDPLPKSHLSDLLAAADTDFIVDMTRGEAVILDENNTTYLMPESVDGGWQCVTTAADAVLGVQFDE